MTENKSEVIEAQIEEIKTADTLGQTDFSKLFHDARTTGRNRATGVTVQVRVRDGEFEVHDDPIKTRQGEHLCGTNSWDSKVSLPVKPFMETRVARDRIVEQLRSWQRHEAREEEREKERQQGQEYYN